MSAESLVQQMMDTDDQSNLCVVLRTGESGLEVLLVADEKGRWSIPGGHAEDTESHAEACVREVKEETGLDVEVEPLFLADHSARTRPVVLFYAVVAADAEARPGGGDVTKVQWTPVNELGDLNGTDQLAIHVAANRVHNPEALVNDMVEVAESMGYPVADVGAPPPKVKGLHFRLEGKADQAFAELIADWASANLERETLIVGTKLFESTSAALVRASQSRRLNPVLDALLHVSDALWRYQSLIAPRMAEGCIVLEVGPALDQQRLLSRGLPKDILENMVNRIPKPTATFNVGDDTSAIDSQAIKNCIEHISDSI